MRVTSTNSGADSKGVVRFGKFALEGEAYLYVVVGAVLTLFVFILCYQFAMLVRLVAAAVPLAVAVGWVKFFIIGRPPHFQGDYFERLLAGRHFNLRPQDWVKATHPRGNRVRGS